MNATQRRSSEFGEQVFTNAAFCDGQWPGLFVFHLRKAGAATPEIKMSEILKTVNCVDRAQQVINKRRDIFRVSIEPIQSRTCDVVSACVFLFA